MNGRSALYAGGVVHVRTRPVRHRLRYRVFTVLLDLDDLASLAHGLRLFGVNRAAPLSFHERDHGAGETHGLKDWVLKSLKGHGIDTGGGPVSVLCYPRMFGYVFNPISVYFCHAPDGRLAAMLYEVSNTHGERVTYAAAVTGEGDVRQEARKRMYVSPFIEMGCRYAFRVQRPGPRVAISVSTHDRQGLLLNAVFSGERRALGDGVLAWALLAYPLMTLKVIAAIHWQALRLWLKGVPFLAHRRQATSPTIEVPRKP